MRSIFQKLRLPHLMQLCSGEDRADLPQMFPPMKGSCTVNWTCVQSHSPSSTGRRVSLKVSALDYGGTGGNAVTTCDSICNSRCP